MTRVAAYCRVSTDLGDQVNSFESQKLFFKQYIDSHKDWELHETYADEGISGTATADRTGFLKMIDDASEGKFGLILTKEVSRFSRNILDTIAYTRLLKKNGIGVLFLNDGIFTLDPDAELRLGIMASVAQEESRKTSERVKWGQRRRMERGVVFGRSLLGYDVRGGVLSVEPKGAETVRMIYEMYVREGLGVRAIAGLLTRQVVPTASGNSAWSGSAVLKILRNEKYCGDLRQRKTVTADFLTHKKMKNRDGGDMIFLKDHHEPVVGRELWEKAQAELTRRASGRQTPPETCPMNETAERSAGCGSRYALSGKVLCGVCGRVFGCRTRYRRDGVQYRVWRRRCGCSGPGQVREDVLGRCIGRFIAGADRETLLKGFQEVMERAVSEDDGSAASDVSAAEKKLVRLAEAYIAGDIGSEAYLKLKDACEERLLRSREKLLRQEEAKHTFHSHNASDLTERIADGAEDFLDFYLRLIASVAISPEGSADIGLYGMTGKLLAVSG